MSIAIMSVNSGILSGKPETNLALKNELIQQHLAKRQECPGYCRANATFLYIVVTILKEALKESDLKVQTASGSLLQQKLQQDAIVNSRT